MSDGELDFDADELAMLRQLFRDEAKDALETVTTRVLAGGSAKPTPDALTEMMRVTHTLKGAAGTVGLNTMVDLSHRLESALAAFGRDRARGRCRRRQDPRSDRPDRATESPADVAAAPVRRAATRAGDRALARRGAHSRDQGVAAGRARADRRAYVERR